MPRSSMGILFVNLLAAGTPTKEEILRAVKDDPVDLSLLRRRSEPQVAVTLHLLGEARAAPRARGTGFGPAAGHGEVEPVFAEAAQEHLYDLSPQGRADVLRVGRHPDQDFQLMDPTVSREHGLVLLHDDVVYYCDYGTLQSGDPGDPDERPGRHGSMNGTFLNGMVRVKNRLLRWEEQNFLTLGDRVRPYQGARQMRFKLTYRRLERRAADGQTLPGRPSN